MLEYYAHPVIIVLWVVTYLCLVHLEHLGPSQGLPLLVLVYSKSPQLKALLMVHLFATAVFQATIVH